MRPSPIGNARPNLIQAHTGGAIPENEAKQPAARYLQISLSQPPTGDHVEKEGENTWDANGRHVSAANKAIRLHS